MDKPRYEHDCSRCIFLGGYIHEGDRYDLYACRQDVLGYTVIARFGSDGPDYTSGVHFAERHLREGRVTHPLAVAMQRVIDAVEKGACRELGEQAAGRLVLNALNLARGA